MKIRNGYVSNSSSSSFVIASNVSVTLDMIEKIFETDNAFFKPIGRKFADILFDHKEKITDMNDLYVVSKEDVKDYTHIYVGNVHDYGGDCESDLESALCTLDINYKDENIMVIKEGGY